MAANLRTIPESDTEGEQALEYIAKKVGELSSMKVEVYEDPDSGGIILSGQGWANLKSKSMMEIQKSEVSQIVNSICKFINAVEGLRS